MSSPLWKSGYSALMIRPKLCGCGPLPGRDRGVGAGNSWCWWLDHTLAREHRYPAIDANMAAIVVPDRQWMRVYWRIYDAIQLRISPVQTKAADLEIERRGRERGRGGVGGGGGGTWCCVTRCVWHTRIRVMDRLLATEIVSAIVTDKAFNLWLTQG